MIVVDDDDDGEEWSLRDVDDASPPDATRVDRIAVCRYLQEMLSQSVNIWNESRESLIVQCRWWGDAERASRTDIATGWGYKSS